jgi:hypothetical protein
MIGVADINGPHAAPDGCGSSGAPVHVQHSQQHMQHLCASRGLLIHSSCGVVKHGQPSATTRFCNRGASMCTPLLNENNTKNVCG